jgi:RimJ/RimL family protein N-acetyltransferase
MYLPPLPIAIETERLLLRPWQPEDAPALYEAVIESRERVGKWLPWVQYYTEPAAATFFIQQCIHGWSTGTELPLAIFDRETGAVLGGTGLHSTRLGTPIRWDWGSFETGYWLRDGAEGKGYVREAVRAEIRLVFEHFKGRKLTIRCDARNDASRKVAESLGLELDVRARNDSIGTDGTIRTTLFFSLLASEAEASIASWKDERFDLAFDPDAPAIHFTPPSNQEESGVEAQAFSRPLRIEGERLMLRPPGPTDAPAWFDLIERSRSMLEAWLPIFRRIRTIHDAAEWIRTSSEQAGTRRSYDLFAFERATGALIGTGCLHGFVWDVPAVEVDWLVDATRQGEGFATEIGALQAQFAFLAWHANRVEVWTESRNIASVRTAERIGFIREGTVRGEFPNANGAFADWATYSLIPDDLPNLARPLPAATIITD